MFRVFAAFVVMQVCAMAQTPMAAFAEWKAAVQKGDQSALSKAYTPRAETLNGKDPVALKDELAFWSGLKASGMTEFIPRVLETAKVEGKTLLLVRVSMTRGGEHKLASMQQFWAHQPDGWKIVRSIRTPFVTEATRRLPQPPAPNLSLYADPREAQRDLKAALAKAGNENKRVIVVFGGNWCYDCHVLDTTFHSTEFAPLVNANFVVVHINIGDDGKENADLAARLGVALDKGVPSLGVLDPDGKVVYAQKNGEFESTVKIGPEDVRAFLEKWKPSRG